MAFGDTGGVITELAMTCRTAAAGTVAIATNDAVKLTGAYTVDNETDAEDAVFGQAVADAAENDQAIPIRVRGVCVFSYDGAAPLVNGVQGVVASATNGKVKAPAAGNGRGINLKVDETSSLVHVLI